MIAPSKRRERILVYGRSNSGKSSCWQSIAQWAENTDTDTLLYLGDTDHAYDAMLDSTTESHVKVMDLDVNEYRDWLTWIKDTRDKVRPDDWVVVDMMDKAWVAAQSYYWYELSSGDALADIYLRNQKAILSGGEEGEYMGGAHGTNWSIINKFYGAFYQAVISLPCHVLCISPATELREDSKPAERNQWKIGWRPQGQKDLAHGFHTILFAMEMPDTWIYTTIKERGPIGRPTRKLLKGETVQDFVITYLLDVAGWTL